MVKRRFSVSVTTSHGALALWAIAILLALQIATAATVGVVRDSVCFPFSDYLVGQISGVVSEMHDPQHVKMILHHRWNSMTVSHQAVTSSTHELTINENVRVLIGMIPEKWAPHHHIIVLDPIIPSQKIHISSPNLIYLFPVLEQQLDMAALYCSRNGISPMATRVLLRNGTSIASITAAADSAFKRYGLGLPSSSVVVSGATISDELLTSGTTFVVGLTTADVAPLVTFLEAHSDATVIVDFDDLTVLYDTFVTSFGTEYKSAMSRLLYTTNLPRWSQPAEQQTTAPPSVHSNESWKEKCHRIFMDSREREGDHEACMHLKNMRAPPGGRYLHSAAVFRHAMREYYDGMPSEYRTPAGLRAFIALLVADVAAAELIHAPSQSISTPLYHAGRFSVAGIRFGPICDGRGMLSLGGAASVVNYAATDLSLWSYASILQVNITPVLGPVVSDFKASVSTLPEWNHKSPSLGTCSVVALALAVTLACFMLPRREKKIKKCDVTASALVHA